VTSNVLNKSLTLFFFQSFRPENLYLAEIVIIGRVVAGDVSNSGELGFHDSRSSVGRTREAVGEVVGVAGVVRVERLGSIALVVERLGAVRTVDGKVQVVGTETVTVCVAVREQTPLEHLVRASLDAGHHMSGTEGDLFHFGEVVLRVAVQDHTTDWDQRELTMRPNLNVIKFN